MGEAALSSRAVLAVLASQLELGPTGWVDGVSMGFSSSQEIEEYKWLGASPVMRQWIGDRIAKGLRDYGITIKNLPYEATLDIHEDDIRRDKFGQVRLRINQLAQRVNSHWASLLSTLINNGEGSNSGLAYDGQFFFDTDHSSGDSGTLNNDIVAGDYGVLNVADPVNPTSSEMADIIIAGLSQFATFKDDAGEPINENAREFSVMVPPRMFGATVTAIASNLLNTGSGARDNPLRFQGTTVNPVANPRLTGTSKVYMFRTDAEDKPFIRQEDQALRVTAKAEGSEYAHDTKHHQFGVDASRAVGYGLWQYAMLMTLS